MIGLWVWMAAQYSSLLWFPFLAWRRRKHWRWPIWVAAASFTAGGVACGVLGCRDLAFVLAPQAVGLGLFGLGVVALAVRGRWRRVGELLWACSGALWVGFIITAALTPQAECMYR
jgi:hypothetical protein